MSMVWRNVNNRTLSTSIIGSLTQGNTLILLLLTTNLSAPSPSADRVEGVLYNPRAHFSFVIKTV
jgi:hypothetical protein